MSLLAIIPARGGSKGIPRKNIKDFCGKPLIAWTIETAQKVNLIDKLILSTDSHEIATVGRNLGIEVPFLRPAELADDTTPGVDVVLHALDHFPNYSEVLLLQPTSPLRKAHDIVKIIQTFRNSYSPSIISVSKVTKHPYWMFSLDHLEALRPFFPEQVGTTNRQKFKDLFTPNGSLYIAKCDWLKKNRSFVGTGTKGY